MGCLAPPNEVTGFSTPFCMELQNTHFVFNTNSFTNNSGVQTIGRPHLTNALFSNQSYDGVEKITLQVDLAFMMIAACDCHLHTSLPRFQ